METKIYVYADWDLPNSSGLPTSLLHIQKSKVRNVAKQNAPAAPVDIYSTPLFFNVEG